MRKFLLLVLGLGLLVPAQISLARDLSWGVGWGMTRTIWAGGWTSDGYPQAGNGAITLSLRADVPYKENISVVPFASYAWSRHTTSYRTPDYTRYDLWTEYTYYRETQLGAHMHFQLPVLHHRLYIGGGPAVRFHESGKRLSTEEHQMELYRGTAITIGLVGGWRNVGKKYITFIEPQFAFSPDAMDRQETYYAPDEFSVQMGILWK
jgi:hypothetical protein